jgi:molybdopterin synthase catalytic subunit|tara:strand:+ start:5000 stop:5539 length:540 start_codon:yes stop_codon:yes gene_type:complete
MTAMSSVAPVESDTWLGLTEEPLPVEEALRWAGRPDCGAVVLFSGNARDHAEGRADVTGLVYEAYEEHAEPRLLRVADEARRRWPAVARIALLHRVGSVPIGEAAVVVVASSAHRGEAFSAGRFCIDAVKATVPIWKLETWDGGEHWGTDAQHLVDLDDLEWPPDTTGSGSGDVSGGKK